MTHFCNVGTSREPLKLETLNFSWTRKAVSSNEEMQNYVKRSRVGGHVTHFWIFGTRLISQECLKLDTSNLARRKMAVSTNEKMQN